MIEIRSEDLMCPCTSCDQNEFCSEKQTACRTYMNYLNHGFSTHNKKLDNFKIPTKFFYNKCYTNDKVEITESYLLRFGERIVKRGLKGLAFTLYGMSKTEIKKAVRLYLTSINRQRSPRKKETIFTMKF